ncbi:AraC family transcriptional regulator [Spirosoma sp. KCTC 42546]|uniref:helix-turn-helix domain-containing protein n=1 Tax=Spirosoma sp. KCTC 42546 TaxID=2520506 RepID=UPI0011581EE1|nr:helix-turn-helix domain-containing protein [Spirosoma sp. KCTC 42546]QDK82062.1 AraC family transcriptional regulator [Spirosoma sp. KCTC 42546]
MVFFREYAPHPALKSFVRHYWIIHIQLDPRIPGEQLPKKPYPPSTEQCLYFYPYDLPHSVKAGNQNPEGATSGIIVGQALTRMNITINPNYLMLKVSFQPGSLFRLLGVPMNLLVDDHADLEAITGKAIKELYERLPQATDYTTMIRLVEEFLLKKAAQCRQPVLPIDRVAQQMLTPAAYHQLDQLAHDACLSMRQFERKFRERVGVSPKLFTRIARFRQAYKLREVDPTRSWLDIAYGCHYYDPNHLVKDFQQFAGTSPGQLFEEELAHQQRIERFHKRGHR